MSCLCCCMGVRLGSCRKKTCRNLMSSIEIAVNGFSMSTGGQRLLTLRYTGSVVSEMIEVRRWRYLGHTLRRQGSIPHTSLGWAPEGKRRRGRPKKTWRMTALDQLRSFGIQSWEEAAERAKDRKRWREQEMDILAQYSTRNPAT